MTSRRKIIRTSRPQPDKKPTRSELRDRRGYMRELVHGGHTRHEAVQLAVEHLYVSEQIATRLFGDAVAQIRRDFEQDHPDARALQAARIQADLAKLREGTPVWRAKRSEHGNPLRGKRERFMKINWLAIARLEAQLADILGTNEPIRVKVQAEVQVRSSLQAVIANLAPEDKERYIREAIEIERKAGLLPAEEAVSDRSDTLKPT